MASNYNHTAWFYDTLAKMVFGRSIISAQVYLLKLIPPASNILIAGGGTGWILEEIAKIHPGGLVINYVEISANMIALSQKRVCGSNHVNFINSSIEDVSLAVKADVIITPFLFDNFEPRELPAAFTHMHKQLKADGLWLNTDFQLAGHWWHKPLLKSMYLFFKIFKAVDNDQLTDVRPLFNDYDYQIIAEQTFYGRFIHSSALRKIWESIEF